MKLLIGVGVGTILWYAFRRYRKNLVTSPEGWQYAGQLKNIEYFPLTSTASYSSLNEVECTENGLRKYEVFDRHFVLLTENGKMAFAGSLPKMLSIKIRAMSYTRISGNNYDLGIGGTIVSFHSPGHDTLEVKLSDFKNSSEKPLKKERNGFYFSLIEGSEAQHKWFSRVVLNKDDGLKFYMKQEPLVRTNWWSSKKPEFYPIMLMTDRSVEDLNRHLQRKDQVHFRQFRPNFVVKIMNDLCKPYDEDNWLFVRIGNDQNSAVILKFSAYCYRCILPNINLETFERNPNCEPLNTLKKYRIKDNPKEPVMGAYFDVVRTGIVKTGDTVYIKYKNSFF